MEYRPDTKAKRRSDRALVAAYHEAELIKLLDRVRAGFAALDAKTIDAFELDDIIHQYKRATVELWKFCSATGSATALAARAIEQARLDGEMWDWWQAGAPRRRS